MSTHPLHIRLLALVALLGFAACGKTSTTEEVTELRPDDQETAKPAPESQDIQYIQWTPELNIPDPVSISMDNRGRAYVTQTQRRKAQDLDIRNNVDWVPDDVGLTSVEEKREFFKSQLAPEHSEKNKERVQDYNGDGLHDWRDLTVLSERIYLVEDTDGDGFADHKQVYFEDFKTEVTGIAAGVLWHDGDVYATVAPNVWRFRDTDGDDLPDEQHLVAHGFGIHIAYGGHDMHGLIMGPDGKLYWSIGDKGINVLSQEGKRFFYPNQGGVLRANPDGSDFEVYAHGLRNVQEFDFDQYGNWFGVDNDSDQAGERERFIYMADGMDAGWRNDYQYREGKYNPWMEEGMTIPEHPLQPAYILPPISNYIDGPAGFVFNPGTALNERYRDYFFLNGTLNGAQYAFQVEPDGASFKMVNDHKIGEGLPLVGLTWGPDGALYTVDWGGGYPLNQSGAIWKLDTPGGNRELRQEVQKILEEGFSHRSDEVLRDLLAHADQRIRLEAQFELVKRGKTGQLIEDTSAENQLKRVHAVWGLGQLARMDDSAAIIRLVELLDDSDPEIQVQASKVLADLQPGGFDGQLLIPHLRSPHPRVRFQAGLSIGRQKVSGAFEEVIRFIEENNGEDAYLRHAGVMALTGIGRADTLTGHPSEEVRLSAVIALRRAGDPVVADFLDDSSEAVAVEAARAIHDDFSIPEALPRLARRLVTTGSSNEPLIRRLINANFRLGGVNEAYVVTEYASNESNPAAMRLEALAALADWADPPPLDRVDGRRRYFQSRPLGDIASAIANMLQGLLTSPDAAIVEKTMEAANRLSIQLSPAALEDLLRNRQAPSSLRVQAFRSMQDPKTVTYALNSQDEGLRMEAAHFLVETNAPSASGYLATRLERSRSLTEKQQVLAMLAELETSEADQAIREEARALSEGRAEAGLALDIIEAATKRNMTNELEGFENSRPSESPVAAYIEALEGGDPAAGRVIAQNHLAAQCARCHKFDRGSGSTIGPNLRDIGSKRDREYLLRSLVAPGADIAEGYGMITVALKSGETITAQLGQQNEEALTLILPDGTEKTVKHTEIRDRSEPMSSMPPMGYIMTKRELRDMVAYLSSLK